MDKPEWFKLVKDFSTELEMNGVPPEGIHDVIQATKFGALQELPLRGNMLNLRSKHIPIVRKIYEQVQKEYLANMTAIDM